MTIIGIQFDIAWENKAANFATVERLVAKTQPQKDSLIVLPEMFATGFSMSAAMPESKGGPIEQFLARLAQQYGVYLAAGAAIKGDDGRARNKALVFSPEGQLTAYYAKMRPFTAGSEHVHFTPGLHPVVFTWGEVKVSPFVCYDLRFPELFRNVAARHRPELFIVLANWPMQRIDHWVHLLQARAIENQACVMGVNRIGKDPAQHYAGRSLLIDAHGKIVADAGEGEGACRGELVLGEIRAYRQRLPFLADLSKPGQEV